MYDRSMKININKFLKEKIDKVIVTNQKNIWAADLFNDACNYTDFFDKSKISELVKQGLKEQEAMIDSFYDVYSLDRDDKETNEVINEYCTKRLKCLNTNKYKNNEYTKKVKATGKYGPYSLRMIKYEPYQTFPYDEITVTSDYKEYSNIGYFKEPFSYLALCEGNNIWMSLNPNEIETMEPFIKSAKGNVLVLGLGMGYVPFMMANKPEVKHITIIEKDQNIINLFNKLLFPSFPNKNKIKIIHDDAINYYKNNKGFDYAFADLWHSPEDGLDLFIKLKAIDTGINCWLETSLIALSRRCMITLIEESLEGLDENAYKHARTTTDRVINHYYQKTKNLVINNKDDLCNLLKEETLLNLIIK